ncbi:hypothetical protein LP415_18265 [Polaromonas sp. P1(28)-8]|nr:hypothetical protein LP415_18265 [Polaromonas sp. P1(28)-8]
MEAELLMFIAQTSMNWTQAVEARMGDFSYTSHNDGYQVRRRKNRRNGDVEFEIFKEYRPHLESYLAWRRALFPDGHDTRLFPFITETEHNKRAIKQIGPICEDLQIRFLGPQLLRKTRINFLLRESNDLDMTAGMAQHSKKVLLRHYVQPNHQIAIVEIHRFHQKNDPSIALPGPGSCVSNAPAPLDDIPANAPQPNCVNPSGCLFCMMQRDVDNQDYVWSLASFRHLKALELSTSKQTSKTHRTLSQSADLVVTRITQKLKVFETSSLVRKGWVDESLERVAEGHHHPMWHGFIQLRELGL